MGKARWAPQAYGVYGLELGCSVRRTGAGNIVAAARLQLVIYQLVNGALTLIQQYTFV